MGKDRVEGAAEDGPRRMRDTLQLIEAELPHLRRYARYLRREPDHADDLVQECLARAIAKLHTWQPGTDLRAWLFVILRNCHIDEIRRSRRMDSFDDTAADEPSLTTLANQETSVALSEVRNAFLGLSEEHREVLLLVAIEGLEYEEAAAILEVPVGTVRSRLSRARQALRQALEFGHGRSRTRRQTARRGCSIEAEDLDRNRHVNSTPAAGAAVNAVWPVMTFSDHLRKVLEPARRSRIGA